MKPFDVPGFQVLDVLGRGGMGVVLRARDRALDRVVAIKLLELRAGERALARFRREVRVLAELRHRNIVRVHDAGESDGRPYMIMEAVRGLSLDRRVLEALRSGAPLAPERILRRIREVAEALLYCHQRGVVHRDVKPANIMIDVDADAEDEDKERAVLIDFGALKGALADSDSRLKGLSQQLSASGDIIGTPAFMAPEQLDARLGYGEAGPPCDVWALGATLFYAFAAEPPFEAASNLAMVHALLEQEPRPLLELAPDAPPWVAALCRACLRRHPEERPSMAELAESLASGQYPAAPRPSRPSPRVFAFLGAAAVLGLAAVSVAFWPEPSLRSELLDPDPRARARAGQRLAGQDPREAVDALLNLLEEEPALLPQVKQIMPAIPGAAQALSAAMGEARGARLRFLVEVLGGLGEAGRPALGPLKNLALRSGPARKRAAAEALAALGSGGVEPEEVGAALARVINAAREEEARSILATLVAMGEPADRAVYDIETRGRPEALARAIRAAQERVRGRERVNTTNAAVVRQTLRSYAKPESSPRERLIARAVIIEWGALALPSILEALKEDAAEPRALLLIELLAGLSEADQNIAAARPALRDLAARHPSDRVRAAAGALLGR